MNLSNYDEPLAHHDEHDRSCLKCGTCFTSTWAGERICKRCKQSNDWKLSSPYDAD